MTSVHDSILEDLVYPAEIVGKRIRIRLDATRLIKVHLDKNQQTNIEHKTETFAAIYKRLTGKEVTFEFPEAYLWGVLSGRVSVTIVYRKVKNAKNQYTRLR